MKKLIVTLQRINEGEIMKDISAILKKYNRADYWTDTANFVGIKAKSGYDWFMYMPNMKIYVQCGNTQKIGKDVTHHHNGESAHE